MHKYLSIGQVSATFFSEIFIHPRITVRPAPPSGYVRHAPHSFSHAALAVTLFSCARFPAPSGNAEIAILKSLRAAFAGKFERDMLDRRATIGDQGADYIVYEFVGAENLSIVLTGEAIRQRERLNSTLGTASAPWTLNRHNIGMLSVRSESPGI